MKLFSPDSVAPRVVRREATSFNRRGQIRPSIKNAGQEANISGRHCERGIMQAFMSREVPVLWYRQQAEDLFYESVLLRNVPYRNCWGGISKSEFVYYGPGGLSVRIECRAQHASGSVDEKVNFLRDNAYIAPESAVWIVIAGRGARPVARSFLERECHNWSGKTIRIYDQDDAQKAVKVLIQDGAADYMPKSRIGRSRACWLTE